MVVGNPRKFQFWQGIVVKVNYGLVKWKGKRISFMEKVTMVSGMGDGWERFDKNIVRKLGSSQKIRFGKTNG